MSLGAHAEEEGPEEVRAWELAPSSLPLQGRHFAALPDQANTRSVMNTDQRAARITGVLFLLTFVTAIGALALFQPVLDDPAGYIAGGGSDNRILLGALLEVLLIVANMGTAVVLFPILRRQNETLALGYFAARVVECTFIAIGPPP
jgi:hypothetical protein